MNNTARLKHGFHPQGLGGSWQLWAPRARNVDLVVHHGNAGNGEHRQVIPMAAAPRGWFVHHAQNVSSGLRYSFQLNGERDYPDPASRWQPDGVHMPSAIFRQLDFAWTDQEWRGVELQDLVIYELHVGTFTSAGTFDAIVPRLAQLKELGVTCIELMPVAQFVGNRGWGYDGVYLFAAQQSYGGPAALQRLVDACHRHGLAILLDTVYNHLGPEGNYLAQYGPYFTGRYFTPWGQAWNYDDRGCDEVREFVLENVRYWLEDFHFDGLRLDAIDTIYDNSPSHILRDIQRVAEDVAARNHRPLHIIPESDLNDVRLLDPPLVGGYGLAAQWSDDFHHCVHSLLTGERRGYYDDFARPECLVKALEHTFVYDGIYSEFRGRRHGVSASHHPGHHFVVCIQNHDQVGNRASGDRLGTLLNPAQLRLAAGLLLLSPHVPLLFMGEEYGESNPFPYFCHFGDAGLIESVRVGRQREFARLGWPDHNPDPQDEQTFASAVLSWDWSHDHVRAGLRQWYADLLAARKNHPPLQDFTLRRALWHSRPQEHADRSGRFSEGSRATNGVLEFLRGGSDVEDGSMLLAFFNFSEQPQPLPTDGLIERSGWQLVFLSELPHYGGVRPTGSITTGLVDFETAELMPFEVMVLSKSSEIRL